MFDRARAILGRRSLGLSGWLGVGNASTMIGQSYDAQAREGYAGNATVFRCIRMRAQACASIPWLLYSDRTKRREIESHPLLDLLARPNENDPASVLVENLSAYLDLCGNAYLYAPPVTDHHPMELYVLRSGSVTPVWTSFGLTHYQYALEDGMVQNLRPEDVMHLKLWNPLDPRVGLSPLSAAALNVAAKNEAGRWNFAVLKNGGRTSGMLSTDSKLTKDQREALKSDWREKHAGAGNAGKMMVLESGLHWEQTGLTPQDMDFLNAMKWNTREICQVFDVPPQLIGDRDAMTYANYREARKALYMEGVIPRMTFIRDALALWLVPKFDRTRKLFLDYDKDGIDALQEDRAELWKRVAAASWLTINEKRAATGYDDVGPDGDVILVPAAQLPLGSDSEPAKDDGAQVGEE